jgi:hypothetical protein
MNVEFVDEVGHPTREHPGFAFNEASAAIPEQVGTGERTTAWTCKDLKCTRWTGDRLRLSLVEVHPPRREEACHIVHG